MAENPTYLLAPNFTFKPGGPIALGSIVADPFRPHRVLTAVDTATLAKDYPRVERFVEGESKLSRNVEREASLAMWVQFLNNVGLSASSERGSTTSSDHSMETLETHYFVDDPNHEEIMARIKAPRVQAVMKGGVFGRSQPVYMVTGLKIATGFSAVREKGRHSVEAAEASGAAPSSAGQASVGSSTSRSRELKDRHEWKGGEDLVFSYQLLKIELKGWKNKTVTYDEFRHKAAYLSTDDDDDDDDDDEEEEEKEEGTNEEKEEGDGEYLDITTTLATASNLSEVGSDFAISIANIAGYLCVAFKEL